MPPAASSNPRYLVALLAVVLFVNYVDRGAIPTAAHLIQDDLHLTATELGLLFSAFFWTYTCVQIPVGWLAERYGAHRVLAAGVALWATATMLVGAAHSFSALLLLRLCLGVGESVSFPSVSKLLAAVVPARQLGSANGVVAFTYLFGPAFGTYVGGKLFGLVGWQATFVIFGGLSLLWLWPWLRVTLPPAATQRGGTDLPPLWLILRQPALWGTSLGLFATNYTFYFMMSWLPFYLVRERGFTTAEMATLAGAAYAVNAFGAIATGWLVDRFIARGGSANFAYKWAMGLAHGGAVVCMLIMAAGSRPWALCSIYAYEIMSGASCACCYAIPQILAGARATGRWVGIQNSIGSLAGIIAPALTGWTIEVTHRFTAAFLLAAVVSIFGVIGWVAMLPTLQELCWDEASAKTSAALKDARRAGVRRAPRTHSR